MPSGLVALLDDIATLAKATASSLDDIAAGAVKASSKAVGVVIDDTAVTPQYVQGLSPDRELPIIGRIAKGSLINKLFIVLPVALALTWLAPWALPILLIAGGSYLCFEGGEKVLSALGWLPHHQAGAGSEEGPETAPQEVERRIVASATLRAMPLVMSRHRSWTCRTSGPSGCAARNAEKASTIIHEISRASSTSECGSVTMKTGIWAMSPSPEATASPEVAVPQRTTC